MYTASMLSIARRAFNLQQEQDCGHIRETRLDGHQEPGAHTQATGLRILTHDAQDRSCSSHIHHILLKRPAFTRVPPSAAAAAAVDSSLRRNSASSDEYSCFLKYCCLCRAPLRQDRDIYMYRGDQGFCSIECRNTQIVSDEMAKIGQRNKTRRRLVSAPQDCHSGGQYCSETCKLLQDMRQRRKNRLLPSGTNQSQLVPL